MPKEPERWDDAVLVSKAMAGDGSAWGEIVDRYNRYVYSILRSCRVPEDDQADAFQYVFVELFKSLSKISSTDNLTPWIRQTTIRHAIKLREQSKKTDPLPEFDIPSPEDFSVELEKSEINQTVRSCVRELESKCRRLITMLFFEDPVRPYAEIATELGIKIGSIGNSRIRCLDALQKILSKRGME